MRKYFFCAANSKLLKSRSIFQKSSYLDTLGFEAIFFSTILTSEASNFISASFSGYDIFVQRVGDSTSCHFSVRLNGKSLITLASIRLHWWLHISIRHVCLQASIDVYGEWILGEEQVEIDSTIRQRRHISLWRFSFGSTRDSLCGFGHQCHVFETPSTHQSDCFLGVYGEIGCYFG